MYSVWTRNSTFILHIRWLELLKDLLFKRFLRLDSRKIVRVVFLGDRISFFIKNHDPTHYFDIVGILHPNPVDSFYLQAYLKIRYYIREMFRISNDNRLWQKSGRISIFSVFNKQSESLLEKYSFIMENIGAHRFQKLWGDSVPSLCGHANPSTPCLQVISKPRILRFG